MCEQLLLPLVGGWPEPQRRPPPSDQARHHPRSLAPRGLDDGGCFDYSATPAIFLGRTGFGPLRIAWDTNVLIDWRDFGHLLLSDEETPTVPDLDPGHEADLVALGTVMTLWMTRDVRIYPLRRQMRDFGRGRGKPQPRQLVEERARQLDEIASALWCVGLSGEFKSPSPGAREWVVPSMKPSADRTLVEEAVVRGCHVFLTRDRKILQRRPDLAQVGIVPTRPTDLLDALSDSGETEQPLGADGMICDNHKWMHLETATREAEIAV
jgi:hypothetical protein